MAAPGGEVNYPIGEVKMGELAMKDGDEGFTNGTGMIVTLDAGEGALFYVSPVELGHDYALMRIAVRVSQSGVQFGLGGLNANSMVRSKAQVDGSIDVTLQNNLQRFENTFGWVELMGKAHDGVLFPVFQMINPTDQTVRIELDNLTIHRIPCESIMSLID